MHLHLLAVTAVLALSTAATAQTTSDDPYLWLEEWKTPRVMEWVESHNAATVSRLEADPPLRNSSTPKRWKSPEPRTGFPRRSFIHGEVFNFWQDADHLRGIWRKTSLDDYRGAAPTWTTVLDIDAINAAEGKSWVWKGAACLPPAETRCLVQLSDGGEDAVEVREFDLGSEQLREWRLQPAQGQAATSHGKTRITSLVAAEWTPGDVTELGLSLHREAAHPRTADLRGDRSLSRQERRRRLRRHARMSRRDGAGHALHGHRPAAGYLSRGNLPGDARAGSTQLAIPHKAIRARPGRRAG